MAVMCDGVTIVSQASLRYLGVTVDAKMGFVQHAMISTARATESCRQLARIMPNVGEPRQRSRRLLASVATPRLLYAAPIWARNMLASGMQKMASAHRRSMVRVASCYRTVSYVAAAVVSGIAPIHLLAEERAAISVGTNREWARAQVLASADLLVGWVRETFGKVNCAKAEESVGR